MTDLAKSQAMPEGNLFPYVVADIGGTNARWGLVSGVDSHGHFVIERVHTFENKCHPKFENSLAAYLDFLGGVSVRKVCVALAGPVMGDRIEMTNINWAFSIAAVAEEFQLEKLLVVNDFTALAYATSAFAEKDLLSIKPGKEIVATRAILGPGTGLGMASLVPLNGHWFPVSGEGGHTAFAPFGAEEIEVCRVLQEQGYVSKETLLSGSGLERIYKVLAKVRGQIVEPKSASSISGFAVSNANALAVDTLNLFCAVLGSAAADLVLTVGAQGGVYLGGGILPRVREFLLKSPFVERFSEKGIMSHYLVDVPVYLIVAEEPALVGAAALLAEQS